MERTGCKAVKEVKEYAEADEEGRTGKCAMDRIGSGYHTAGEVAEGDDIRYLILDRSEYVHILFMKKG